MLPRAAAHWRVLTDSGEAILHDVQLGNKQNLEKRRGVNETEAVAAFRGRIPPWLSLPPGKGREHTVA